MRRRLLAGPQPPPPPPGDADVRRAAFAAFRAAQQASALQAALAAAGTNQDIVVSTSGRLGASRLSRTFATAAGTEVVRVRFRFLTTEVPGGYFGTKYNDYYSITARSKQSGAVVGDVRLELQLF
jgi:type II secretory pathway pseudopilin PulG